MLDRLVVDTIVEQVSRVGQLFLADFIGIDRFEMGALILIILVGSMVSVMLGGGRRVR